MNYFAFKNANITLLKWFYTIYSKFTALYLLFVSLKNIHILLIFLFLSSFLTAQNLSNFYSDTIVVTSDSVLINNKTLIPESLQINYLTGDTLSKSLFSVSEASGFVYFDKGILGDSIVISYRIYPYSFRNRVFTNDYDNYKSYRDSTGFLINANSLTKVDNSSLVDFGRLNYNGDVSRGLSFGNGQNVNLNSSFNLQLAGELAKDLEVKAAITDNNIPIQPEGNTANLQDFDKIFVQLKYKTHFLQVGDFDVKSMDSYFMKFQKSLQGLSYWGIQEIGGDYIVNAKANVSVSRGKYTLNNLVAEEGNQGPYRLTGADGETFIVILSGSERVFIDGELMQRGANNDYTIDYNLGEISFTPNKLITKNLRIKVEFEYSDNSYFRYLYHLNAGIQNEVWGFDANFYSEQDIKNQAIGQDLSDDKINTLVGIGDSVNQAFYSGVSAIDFVNDRVLYQKLDTIVNGLFVDYYKYSTDSSLALYALSFSFVGEGNGSYIPIESVANGRVYEWVSPSSDASLNGSYEPIVLLVTPKQRQLFTAELHWKPSNTTKLAAEFALSNQDVNTFSPVDDEDDIGFGIHVKAEDTRYLNTDSTNRLVLNAQYEFKESKFLPIERYRNIEFTRDWNINSVIQADEHLGFLSAQFVNTQKGSGAYKFSFFNQENFYSGFENEISGLYEDKGYSLQTKTKWLQSKSDFFNEQTNFIRPSLSISKEFKKLKKWEIGLDAFNEINRISDLSGDSISDESFWWQDYTIYIASPDSLKSKLKFSYNLRYEHLPNSSGFDNAYLRANTFSLEGSFVAKRNHNLNWTVNYRNLQQDTLLNANDDFVHFYLGRINYRFNFLKGVIKGNSLYEIGSGREQRIQYNYLEAPDGQGNYAWQDINENGIQELNEFYVSSFENDNRFLRLISNSLEFQAVNSTMFNQSLQLNPKKAWFDKGGIRSFVARFSSITSISLNKKIFASKSSNFLDIINPVSLTNNTDTLLVSNSNLIRNTVYFNRNSSSYAFDYTFTYNENVSLLTSGFEKRLYSTHILKARWNISKQFTWISQYTNGFKRNDSDFYFDRKYEYLLNEVETSLSLLLNKVLRVGINYRYAFRTNPQQINGGQFAVINETGLEARYAKAGNFSVQTNFRYSSVAYNDDLFQNEQLQIDMLQNLQDGNNYIWSISFDKTIAKNFQFSLVYDGRKTGLSKIIHTGRAQVRAIF